MPVATIRTVCPASFGLGVNASVVARGIATQRVPVQTCQRYVTPAGVEGHVGAVATSRFPTTAGPCSVGGLVSDAAELLQAAVVTSFAAVKGKTPVELTSRWNGTPQVGLLLTVATNPMCTPGANPAAEIGPHSISLATPSG